MPRDPSIFRITHIRNLAGILREGCLWCDSQRLRKALSSTNIGHVHLKTRRLSRKVETEAGGCLGDYVPFNFCPRSVMLYAVHRGHQDYKGGQDPIVHLVSRISLAVSTGSAWAFSDRHAELGHARHFDDLNDLSEVDWSTMEMPYWKDIKEERQAEFLVHDKFPWELVQEIGVRTGETAQQVKAALSRANHRPSIVIRPEWYY